jgi:2-polyprenyl-6-methoxyphenol hydroxylase-like FAD-dependent oxidoreductase
LKVVIVGAGLSGLALTHGLRQAGIDAQVFERHDSAADRPASYGIHLNGDGLRALHGCLPPANWKSLDAAAVLVPDVLRFHDHRLRPLLTVDLGRHANDPITHRRAVSRDALRAALLLGLDDDGGESVVHWGREFVGYRELDGGGVDVCFADGSTVRADLVVGADGANSRVRAQRLAGLDRVDLGILNIAGRSLLTPSLTNVLPPSVVDGSVNNIVPAGPGWMFVSTWTGGEEVPESGEKARLIVWAWAAARSSYPDVVDGWDGIQLRHWVASKIEGWAPALRAMVDASDPVSVAPVPLRSMPHLPSWATTNVTLIGDAIHNMTPMAGIGANTALRDADVLRRQLVDRSAVALSTRVGDYESAMRSYANAALARSTRNAQNATTTSQVKRTMFRALLRTASATPPLTRSMFGPHAVGSRERSV